MLRTSNLRIIFILHTKICSSNERGAVALLLTVIILSIIFVIATGMAVIRIIEIQLASSATESVVAYQAADAGVECALNQLQLDLTGATVASVCPNGTLVGAGAYNIKLIYEGGNVKRIKSIGESQKTKRAVEATLP